ncbi:MAG: hypothetical protein BGO69_08930 [Bacteroidetes bacterium 46-16]|nr:MAG: hypothetical protein BGO69_08930 [Bacteroidetes bacterium 46-16]
MEKHVITDLKHLTEIAGIFKAIAHPERVGIMQVIYREKRIAVKGIYERLRLQQSVVSRHLGILRSAGVVRREQQGQKIYYCPCFDNKTLLCLPKCIV